MNDDLTTLAKQVGELLKKRGLKIATGESCTGGWIAKTITDIPGSSLWFDRGFITYSDASKIQMLGVNEETLAKYGAVSEQAAREMAEGALKNSEADLAVVVTGIAGPDGGTDQKPVGTVFIAWKIKSKDCVVAGQRFQGGRRQVREQTVEAALAGLKEIVL
ncbi:MAG: CinA family protein [Gammaproteobacteria bacterium]